MAVDEQPSPQTTPTHEPSAAAKAVKAAKPRAEKKEALPRMRVALALLFLLAFSLSFATVSEFYAFARQSADAEIAGPFNCSLVYGEEAANRTAARCPPDAAQLCANVTASVVDEAGNATRKFVLHQLFHDYFDRAECSYVYCSNESPTSKATHGSKLRTLQRSALERSPAAAAAGVEPSVTVPCWLDATKPDRAFLELQDFDQGKFFFSKAAAYVILVLPPVGIVSTLAAVLGCLIVGKLTVPEIKLAVPTSEVKLPADVRA